MSLAARRSPRYRILSFDKKKNPRRAAAPGVDFMKRLLGTSASSRLIIHFSHGLVNRVLFPHILLGLLEQLFRMFRERSGQ